MFCKCGFFYTCTEGSLFLPVFMGWVFNIHLYFLRERECMCTRMSRGRWAEGDQERILSRLHAPHRDWHTAGSHDPGIMTWVKIKSGTLNWLSHLGAPDTLFEGFYSQYKNLLLILRSQTSKEALDMGKKMGGWEREEEITARTRSGQFISTRRQESC